MTSTNEVETDSIESLLLGAHPGSGPRWRVAIVRPGGQTARLAAAEVARQLREDGSMAVDLDAARGSAWEANTVSERAAAADSYDLVLAIGGLTRAAIELGVLSGAPVAEVATSFRPPVPGAIVGAISAGRFELVPVLTATIDGQREISAGPLRVATHGDTLLRITSSCSEIPARAQAVWITPLAGPDGLVETRSSEGPVTERHRVDLEAGRSGLTVEVDGHSRWARHVTIEGVPQGLRRLDLTAGAA